MVGGIEWKSNGIYSIIWLKIKISNGFGMTVVTDNEDVPSQVAQVRSPLLRSLLPAFNDAPKFFKTFFQNPRVVVLGPNMAKVAMRLEVRHGIEIKNPFLLFQMLEQLCMVSVTGSSLHIEGCWLRPYSTRMKWYISR
jgi:hypothetical protein